MNRQPAALAAASAARRARSEARVAAAIALLEGRGDPVSKCRIRDADAELEPGAPRLSESMISRNPAAYALYDAARSQRRLRSRRPRRSDPRRERKTKAELIDEIHDLKALVAQLELCLRQYAFPDAPAR